MSTGEIKFEWFFILCLISLLFAICQNSPPGISRSYTVAWTFWWRTTAHRLCSALWTPHWTILRRVDWSPRSTAQSMIQDGLAGRTDYAAPGRRIRWRPGCCSGCETRFRGQTSWVSDCCCSWCPGSVWDRVSVGVGVVETNRWCCAEKEYYNLLKGCRSVKVEETNLLEGVRQFVVVEDRNRQRMLGHVGFDVMMTNRVRP